MSLSDYERTVLLNQIEILSTLRRLEAKHTAKDDLWRIDVDLKEYARQAAILEHGYEGEYESVVGARRGSVPSAETKAVRETLLLFQALSEYLEEHPSDTDAAGHLHARFGGFGGNDDGHALGYVRFLTTHTPEFPFLKRQGREGDSLDSHMPTAQTYGPMMAAWGAQGSPRRLTKEQAHEILRASER